MPQRDAPLLSWLPSWHWTAWSFGTVTILLAVALEGSYRLAGRITDPNRREQALDKLAQLRATGIQLLNADGVFEPNAYKWYKKWWADQQTWSAAVSAVLRDYFPERTRLRFENLGTFPAQNVGNPIGTEHQHDLNMLAERLAVVEDIISGKHGAPP